MSKPMAAQVLTAILGGVLLFQLLLIAGTPWGEAAFGGAHRVLPTELRIASAIGCVLYVVQIFLLRARAGLRSPIKSPRIARIGSWVTVGLFTLGLVLNAISQSRYENFIWAPVLALCTCLAWVVARGR